MRAKDRLLKNAHLLKFPSLRQAQGRKLARHGEPVEPSGGLHLDIFEQPAEERRSRKVIKMEGFIQVTTTTEKREDAERIALTLVEARLAACVQIVGPITSIYRWKGNIETAGEWLCLIKSREENYGAIEQTIRSLHPYETPEIVAVAVTGGSRDYLDWLRGELAAPCEE
jgi:periplasmic divalent cation tolerance protein